MAIEKAEFGWRDFCITQMRPEMPGLRHVELNEFYNYMYGHMVNVLKASVLKYDGGEPATDQVRVTTAIKPWWIPGFIWKRMPAAELTWTLTARPEWVFPFATWQLPDNLGRPVQFLMPETTVRHGD